MNASGNGTLITGLSQNRSVTAPYEFHVWRAALIWPASGSVNSNSVFRLSLRRDRRSEQPVRLVWLHQSQEPGGLTAGYILPYSKPLFESKGQA